MKKEYLTPVSGKVNLQLHGSVLLDEGPIGGQTYNPVDPKPADRSGVEWSAKGQDFDMDPEQNGADWSDDTNDMSH